MKSISSFHVRILGRSALLHFSSRPPSGLFAGAINDSPVAAVCESSVHPSSVPRGYRCDYPCPVHPTSLSYTQRSCTAKPHFIRRPKSRQFFLREKKAHKRKRRRAWCDHEWPPDFSAKNFYRRCIIANGKQKSKTEYDQEGRLPPLPTARWPFLVYLTPQDVVTHSAAFVIT